MRASRAGPLAITNGKPPSSVQIIVIRMFEACSIASRTVGRSSLFVFALRSAKFLG
jgi:hypothetical protein